MDSITINFTMPLDNFVKNLPAENIIQSTDNGSKSLERIDTGKLIL